MSTMAHFAVACLASEVSMIMRGTFKFTKLASVNLGWYYWDADTAADRPVLFGVDPYLVSNFFFPEGQHRLLQTQDIGQL